MCYMNNILQIMIFFKNISCACLAYLIIHNLRPVIIDNLILLPLNKKWRTKREREREREEINYSSLYEEQMAVGHTVYGKERIFLFCSQLY